MPKLPKFLRVKKTALFLIFGVTTWALTIFGSYLQGRTFDVFPPWILPLDIFPALGFLIFSLVTLIRLLCDFKNSFLQLATFITACLWAAPFTFTVPRFEDGMADKLCEKVSEKLLLEFAAEIRRQHKVHDPELTYLVGHDHWEWPGKFQELRSLFGTEPTIGVSPDSVSLEWGSALVGHWGVIIFDNSPPKAPPTGPYSYNPGLFSFERVWVYRGM